MTDQVTFETQLRDMCERYGFRCDIIFPEGHVKIYWEDGVILYKDSISKSLYRFIREFRDIDVDYFEWYQIPPPEVRELMEEHIKDGMSYDECYAFFEDLETVGWTFSFGLDGEPYKLCPIL